MSITDLKDGEMVWKLTENKKIARNDYLKVKFIVTTFVHMKVNLIESLNFI